MEYHEHKFVIEVIPKPAEENIKEIFPAFRQGAKKLNFPGCCTGEDII